MVEGRTLPGVPFLDFAVSHGPLKAAIPEEISELIARAEVPIGRCTNGTVSRQGR